MEIDACKLLNSCDTLVLLQLRIRYLHSLILFCN